MNQLAIIIPFYKMDFITETLNALSVQTDKRFTVYIGNDASTKDIEPLLALYPTLTIVYQYFDTNFGGHDLVGQWLRCIAMMQKEEWFILLGDDDMLEDKVVEDFYNNLPFFANQTHLIRFASQLIDDHAKTISVSYAHPLWETGVDAYMRKLLGQTRSSLSEYIFNKQRFDQIGFVKYPLAWSTDDRAVADFGAKYPIYSINTSKVLVRISGVNISGTNKNEDIKQIALLQQRFDFYMQFQHKLNKEQKRQVLHDIDFIMFQFGNFTKAQFRKFIGWSLRHRSFKSSLLSIKSYFQLH